MSKRCQHQKQASCSLKNSLVSGKDNISIFRQFLGEGEQKRKTAVAFACAILAFAATSASASAQSASMPYTSVQAPALAPEGHGLMTYHITGQAGRGLMRAADLDENPLAAIGGALGGSAAGAVVGEGARIAANRAYVARRMANPNLQIVGEPFGVTPLPEGLISAEALAGGVIGLLAGYDLPAFAGPQMPQRVQHATISISIPTMSMGLSHNASRQQPNGVALGRGLYKAGELDENPFEGLVPVVGSTGAGTEIGYVAGAVRKEMLEEAANRAYDGEIFLDWAEQREAAQAYNAAMQAAGRTPKTFTLGGAAVGAMAGLAMGYSIDPDFTLSCRKQGATFFVKSHEHCGAIGGALLAFEQLAERGLMKAAELDENPLMAAGISAYVGVGGAVAGTHAAGQITLTEANRRNALSKLIETSRGGNIADQQLLAWGEGEIESLDAAVARRGMAGGLAGGLATAAIGFGLNENPRAAGLTQVMQQTIVPPAAPLPRTQINISIPFFAQ